MWHCSVGSQGVLGESGVVGSQEPTEQVILDKPAASKAGRWAHMWKLRTHINVPRRTCPQSLSI